MQVAGDAFAVLADGEPLAVGEGLRELQRQRGLTGDRGRHLDLEPAEPGPVVRPPDEQRAHWYPQSQCECRANQHDALHGDHQHIA